MNATAADSRERPAVRKSGRAAAGVRIAPYSLADRPAALAFNQRMVRNDAPTDFVLPDRPNETGIDVAPDAITWTKYLAIDDTGAARGGFLLMEQPAVVNADVLRVANYQAPVSEGIVDNRFGMIGMHMLRYLVRHWPYAFAVGMGSAERPLPRLLAAAGWSVRPVPFLFKIVRPRRVFRELRILRDRPWLRIGARFAAGSGVASIAAAALHARGRLASRPRLQHERIRVWDQWADTLWASVRDQYSFAVLRDRSTLAALYPLADDRYAAYLLRDDGRIVGWAVCAHTRMRNHNYFGDLAVTSVLDAVALPDSAAGCAAAISRLSADESDLMITNQSHALWLSAFRQAGYASAPSNYLLATSRRLAEALDAAADRIHVSRGDGDGRIHLL